MLTIPIGHMEGNYFCDDATLAELKSDNRIVFRYSNAQGEITAEANPNGSLENIAGICSPGRNVLGMMPHPERVRRTRTRRHGWLQDFRVIGRSDGDKIMRVETRLAASLSRPRTPSAAEWLRW